MSAAASGAHNLTTFRVIAIRHRRNDRNAHDFFPSALDPFGCRARVAVINVDYGRAACLYIRWKTLLDRGVVLHAAMSIQMVFRHIEQDADRWLK